MRSIESYLEKGGIELGIDLDRCQLEKFALLAAELFKWNKKINLTSINSIEGMATKHFLDSLFVVKQLDPNGDLLDIGSGAGFPAIPLKIVLPSIKIVSVDAVEKKVNFQRHIARLLQLAKFEVVHARAEDYAKKYPGEFTRIISRAFSDIPKFVELSLPFLAQGGIMIAMKGKMGREEANESADKLCSLGASVVDILEFQLPTSREARSLIIIARSNG